MAAAAPTHLQIFEPSTGPSKGPIEFTYQGRAYRFDPNETSLKIAFPTQFGYRIDTLSAIGLTCQKKDGGFKHYFLMAFSSGEILIPEERREEFGGQSIVSHPDLSPESTRRIGLRAGETEERATQLARACAKELFRFYRAYLTIWLPEKHPNDATITLSKRDHGFI